MHVTFRQSAVVAGRVRALAAERGVPMSWLIRDAVRFMGTRVPPPVPAEHRFTQPRRIYLYPSQLELVEELAAQARLSRSEIIRRAIHEHFS